MKWRSFLLAASALVLCGLFAAEASAQGATGSCQGISITTPELPGGSPSRRRPHDFSASEVIDLELQVLVPFDEELSDRRVELKLYTPKGHLYQTLTVPVDRAASEERSAERRRSRFRRLSATLPVAGTTIVNNSLYGTWKAVAYVQGEGSPCAKSRSFAIRP